MFFNREIKVGMSVEFRVTPGKGRQAPYRFEFGFTSCTKKSVMQQPCHLFHICSHTNCRGYSHTVGLKYDAGVVYNVSITRQHEFFVIDAGRRPHHKRFFKHLPDGATPADRWFPFLTLTGDVEAIEIVHVTNNVSPYASQDLPLACNLLPNGSPVPQVASRPSSPKSLIPVPSAKAVSLVQATAHAEGVSHKRTESTVATALSHSSHRVLTSRPTARPFSADSTVQTQAHVAVPKRQQGEEAAAGTAAQLPCPKNLCPPRKWFSHASVSVNGSLICLLQEDWGYAFSTKLSVGERIVFRAERTGDAKSAKLAFGVTRTPLVQLDMSVLPADAAQLSRISDQWSVFPHLITVIGVWDALAIQRTTSGISLMLGDSQHEIISDLDADSLLFPFFHLTHCSLRILSPCA